MKYAIEQFVKKINAPLVCRFDDQELSFDDGKDLAKHWFDKKYEVDSIDKDSKLYSME